MLSLLITIIALSLLLDLQFTRALQQHY